MASTAPPRPTPPPVSLPWKSLRVMHVHDGALGLGRGRLKALNNCHSPFGGGKLLPLGGYKQLPNNTTSSAWAWLFLDAIDLS